MNITPIIETVFALIAAVITAIVIPYIRSKTTGSSRRRSTPGCALRLAQRSRFMSAPGAARRRRHTSYWLAEHGVTLDETRLDAMIEAAVYDLKKGLLPAGGDAQ